MQVQSATFHTVDLSSVTCKAWQAALACQATDMSTSRETSGSGSTCLGFETSSKHELEPGQVEPRDCDHDRYAELARAQVKRSLSVDRRSTRRMRVGLRRLRGAHSCTWATTSRERPRTNWPSAGDRQRWRSWKRLFSCSSSFRVHLACSVEFKVCFV